MPTKNPRLNVVLDQNMYKILVKLAHKEGISLSLMAKDLIKEAIELHEDIYWQKITKEREKTFSYKDALSHKNVWE